jgi:transposase
MKINWEEVNIFIKPGPTDMRKQINGLSVMIQKELNYNPLDGNLYIFCNKNRRRLKILYWDRNGFCLWLKRLKEDKFPWPKNADECKEITVHQLEMLLDGINFFNAHKKLNFSAVS